MRNVQPTCACENHPGGFAGGLPHSPTSKLGYLAPEPYEIEQIFQKILRRGAQNFYVKIRIAARVLTHWALALGALGENTRLPADTLISRVDAFPGDFCIFRKNFANIFCKNCLLFF